MFQILSNFLIINLFSDVKIIFYFSAVRNFTSFNKIYTNLPNAVCFLVCIAPSKDLLAADPIRKEITPLYQMVLLFAGCTIQLVGGLYLSFSRISLKFSRIYYLALRTASLFKTFPSIQEDKLISDS